MSANDFIDLFRKNPQVKIFHLHDLALFLGKEMNVLSVELNRMVKAGVILRLANGYYANPASMPDPDLMSMVLKKPCYISMEKALSLHGLYTHQENLYTLVTPGLTYHYRIGNVDYEYHHIQSEYYFGYEINQHHILVADQEKALLDLIYLRYYKTKIVRVCSLKEILQNIQTDRLRIPRFRQYVKKMNLTHYLLPYFSFIREK